MACQVRRILGAAGLAAVLCGALNGASASAQMMPPLVGLGPAVANCALVTDLSPCIDAAMPTTPVIVGGIVALDPLGGSGHGNVDVDKDVDSSRQHGRVIIR